MEQAGAQTHTPTHTHFIFSDPNTGKCFSLYLVSSLISPSEFGVTLDNDLKGNA